MQYKETEDLYLRYERLSYSSNTIGLIVGAKCNSNCDHCFEKGNFSENLFISDEIINKVFEFIDQTGEKDYLIDIMGGETLLYPEICKKICDKANERNILTELVTNGFLGNDKLAIKFLINEIKPSILNISVDKYHQKYIPINIVQNFVNEVYDYIPISINYCYDSQDPLFKGKSEIERSIIIQNELVKIFPNKDLYLYMEEIISIGNAKKNNIGTSVEILKNVCKYYCVLSGIYIDFEGNMNKKCFLHQELKEECKLGKIKDIKNFNLIFSELKKNIYNRSDPDLRSRKIGGFIK